MSRRARAFTLVELMVVVALIGVIAAVAVVSMRRSRSTHDSDAWASALRNMASQARRRAVATKKPYMLEVGDRWVRWCQVMTTQNNCLLDPKVCPATASANQEMGGRLSAPADAVTDRLTDVAEQVTRFGSFAAGVPYPIPANGSRPIYFNDDGTATLNYCTPSTVGVTIYVRASNLAESPGTTSETQKHRRVVISGITGRARIIDNW
jgi:prepilin-type N-terminal cleavage/methylation domain-containing protein